jgi:DNA-binding XRE family transcriptional regulator
MTMAKNVNEIIRRLSPARRKRVEQRAAQLIAEEMTRQELRRALERTQVEVARKLGITQDGVSRLEQRTDILLSTLRSYIAALGGRLSLIAEFPDHEPVVLSGIADQGAKPDTSKSRKRVKAYA